VPAIRNPDDLLDKAADLMQSRFPPVRSTKNLRSLSKNLLSISSGAFH
jgi:hypothetical protein